MGLYPSQVQHQWIFNVLINFIPVPFEISGHLYPTKSINLKLGYWQVFTGTTEKREREKKDSIYSEIKMLAVMIYIHFFFFWWPKSCPIIALSYFHLRMNKTFFSFFLSLQNCFVVVASLRLKVYCLCGLALRGFARVSGFLNTMARLCADIVAFCMLEV